MYSWFTRFGYRLTCSHCLFAVDWTYRNIAAVALGVFIGLFVLVAVGNVAYFPVGYGPDTDAWSTVEDDESITLERFGSGTVVRSGPFIDDTVGVIYYPGARVNHESYVPTAAEIITERDAVIIFVDMPLYLTVLASDRAADAITTQPAVESWYIAGHSLDGAMACSYAATNAPEIVGVVLHAAYCDVDISDTDLQVLSVLGTNDGVIDADRERGRRALLPAETEIVELDGVNHAGFGAYGPQSGYNPTSREPTTMRADVAAVTGTWLAGIDTDTTSETPRIPLQMCLRPSAASVLIC